MKFPLDGYPRQKRDIKSFERKKSFLKLQLFSAFDDSAEYSWKAKVLRKVERIMGIHKCTQNIVKRLNSLISRWDVDEPDFICNHGNWQKKLEYAPKEQYGEGIIMRFENIDVRVPEKYDEYLTQKYGDWRADLPLDQQIGHHYYTVCDLAKPYTEYVKKS